MLSTLLQEKIYLGYLSDQILKQPNYEDTFVGGNPIFLVQPSQQLLTCQDCGVKLTFMCQLFAPFSQEHTYNRVLYVLYCGKCYRFFRCIKQQTSKQFEYKQIKQEIESISKEAVKVDSDQCLKKYLKQIKNKANIQVMEQKIEEQMSDEDQQNGQQQIIQIDLRQIQEKLEAEGVIIEQSESKLEKIKQLKRQAQQQEKQQKDQIFEEYIKVMQKLDGPILLYTDTPVQYNKQTLNPPHFCKKCKSKITLELQITQKILIQYPKLVGMEWGSLFIYSCSSSCIDSEQEVVIIQFQTDAISQVQIQALKKKEKNRKKKKRKQQKKQRKNQSIQQKSSEQQQQIQQTSRQQKQQKQQGGDWD